MNPNLGSLKPPALFLLYNLCPPWPTGSFAIILTLSPRLTEQPLFGILPVTNSLKKKVGKAHIDS